MSVGALIFLSTVAIWLFYTSAQRDNSQVSQYSGDSVGANGTIRDDRTFDDGSELRPMLEAESDLSADTARAAGLASAEDDAPARPEGFDPLIENWMEEAGVASPEFMGELASKTDQELRELIASGELRASQELGYRLAKRGDTLAAYELLKEAAARGSIGAARQISALFRIYPDAFSESGMSGRLGAYVWHRVGVSMGDYALMDDDLFRLSAEERMLAEAIIQENIAWLDQRHIELFGDRLPYVPHPPIPIPEVDGT